ncbi:hypothetical protein [Paracoccus spongiarum]|uniref:CGNR zinc finger domain-containing protein n=1 Tax=Paracoccus spongiarum TaxID=3064387 RepID=A0ABT9JB92_9RHOB|nr:hypothetical protein [Paracoccus sp. 2205BS29-5]MDP5306391.1 hypothetical protein [Paracoccus sp. 2205BS29-5]
MLVMTPAAKAMLRKERRRERDAMRGKLGETRHRALVDRLAKTIRTEREAGRIATLFNLEGPLRHAIRSKLCLQGWRWSDADAMARDLLDATFIRLGANRPSWNEGQPEWLIDGGGLIGRLVCARRGCDRPLPEGHRKFCGKLCRDAHHTSIERLLRAGENAALDMAVGRE